MNTIKLGEKGQITLPKAFRERYQFSKGTCFHLVDQGNGIISMIPVQHANEMNAPVLSSALAYCVEDMDEAIGQAVEEEFEYKGGVNKRRPSNRP
jgi:bifunctional DNA-binding transcriptional regulator/antitoxin component of YhaV-PrlF toxin-antitoxin module